MIAAVCLPAAAQWKALGPFGGPAAIVHADPISPKTLLAGTANALLFRSIDGAESWEALPFPLELRSVLHALVVHPGIRNLYFAGISPERAGASGMWRSVDAGRTWLPVPAFGGLQVWSIATFRGNPLVMAAGANNGVFMTTDGGLTWARISPSENRELQPVVSVAFDPKNANVIYAGTPHLPWKTVDGGSSWRSVHLGMMDDSDIFSIVVDRNRPQRVFAGACSGIYRSFNGAANWARLPESKGASYRTYALAQDPQYQNVLFAGTSHGTIRSRDGGATWKRIAPYATRSIAFNFAQLGRIFIATDKAGILRSEDNGETWQAANRGFCNRGLSPLAIDESGTVYTGESLGGAGSAFFVLPSGAEEWSRGRTPARQLLAVMPSPKRPETLYAAAAAAVLVSRNRGQTWSSATLAHGTHLTGLLAPHWESDAVVAAAGSSVLLSRDSAKSWSEVRFPTPVRSLVALDAPWIAAVGDSDIYVSVDGEVWEAYSRVEGAGKIHGVAASRARFFVATATGLRVSDQGRSFRLVSGLPEETVQAICRHPSRPSVLFAASYKSIYTSADAGHTWRRMATDGWPVASIKQLVVTPGNSDRLLVLTPQQGVFALPLDPAANRRTSDSADDR